MSVDRGAAGLVARIALTLGSVIFSLVVLEAGCRLVRSGADGLTDWSNLVRKRMSIVEDGDTSCAYAYDARLGWTAPRNCVSPGYNFDADGFRLTPATLPVAEPPLLVTGSSFALGEETGDDGTWPTHLQKLIGRKVVNAAIGGYALDQTVLRTERLAPRVKPLAIVAGFTPDDIRRLELSVSWSRPKPYFAVVDGRLELRNVPVPGGPDQPVRIPTAGRLFGWSVLADEIMKRLRWQVGWFFDEHQALPAGSGETIACLLMRRLAAIGAPLTVVAQYNRLHWMAGAEVRAEERQAVRRVLRCATDAGLLTLDLSDPLKSAIETSGIDALFHSNHHSAEGNRLTAELIARELPRLRLLP